MLCDQPPGNLDEPTPRHPSFWISSIQVHPPSSDVPPVSSMTPRDPIRSQPGLGYRFHRRPRYDSPLAVTSYSLPPPLDDGEQEMDQVRYPTFFLNCLWIASSASLIVTPFRFRAVTSKPSGKCRSIFLTGGVTRYFFNASFSSKVDGEVFNFLPGSTS